VALIALFVISVKLVIPTVGQEAHAPNGHRSNCQRKRERGVVGGGDSEV